MAPTCDRDVAVCVACGAGGLEPRFTLRVLGRHEAAYVRCASCATLQVPRVDWLAEAYSSKASPLDLGAAQRSIICALYIRAMRSVGLLRRRASILDVGSGGGLLVRLLRDLGFAARGYDRYARSYFAPEHTWTDLPDEARGQFDLVTAFEVLEHLDDPRATLTAIRPLLAEGGSILLRTDLYDPARHGPDWDYLQPWHGQHINFFTRDGLRRLGTALGFATVHLPFRYVAYVRDGREPAAWRRAALAVVAVAHFALARVLGLCTFANACRDQRDLQADPASPDHS